jgi:hypothetical protein
MRVSRRLLLFLGFPMVCSASFPADISVSTGERVWRVGLHGSEAYCYKTQLDDGDWQARCSSARGFVVANTAEGCLDSAGPTFCLTQTPPSQKLSGNELNCPNGESYRLYSGEPGHNNCQLRSGYKRCTGDSPANSAEADCEGGCIRTTGAGDCSSVAAETPEPKSPAGPGNYPGSAPNYHMNPTVGPATGLAIPSDTMKPREASARPAPAPPAGYADR